MGTIIEQSFHRIVNERMTDPQFAGVVAAYLKNLQAGLYTYQDVISQKWARFDYDIYEAYAFSQVHYKLNYALALMAKVKIGVMPCKDKEVEQMNRLLIDNLWDPFSAEFWGGTQDEDGAFRISQPIEFDMAHWKTHEQVIMTADGSFPLEVGYTSAMKTLYYLNTRGRLARWPYNDDTIYLFYTDKLVTRDYGDIPEPKRTEQLSFLSTIS